MNAKCAQCLEKPAKSKAFFCSLKCAAAYADNYMSQSGQIYCSKCNCWELEENHPEEHAKHFYDQNGRRN